MERDKVLEETEATLHLAVTRVSTAMVPAMERDKVLEETVTVLCFACF
jgi:hypothetical protein